MHYTTEQQLRVNISSSLKNTKVCTKLTIIFNNAIKVHIATKTTVVQQFPPFRLDCMGHRLLHDKKCIVFEVIFTVHGKTSHLNVSTFAKKALKALSS